MGCYSLAPPNERGPITWLYPLSEKTYSNSLAIVSNSVASKQNDLNTNFLKQAFFTNSFSSVDSFHCQQAAVVVYCTTGDYISDTFQSHPQNALCRISVSDESPGQEQPSAVASRGKIPWRSNYFKWAKKE